MECVVGFTALVAMLPSYASDSLVGKWESIDPKNGIRMVRCGRTPQGGSSIVGTWCVEPSLARLLPVSGPMNRALADEVIAENLRLIFTADGKKLLRIPFITEYGTRSVKDDRLITHSGHTGRVQQFQVECDTLFFPESEAVYQRAKW